MSEIAAAKAALRGEVRRRMLAMDGERKRAGSAAACERLLAILAPPRARVVRVAMVYSPMPDEMSLEVLVRGLVGRGVRVCLPRQTEGKGLEAAEVEGEAVGAGLGEIFGGGRCVMHPPAGWRAVGAGEIDLIVVPGLAFDRSAHRLGRGGGFYDRFLANPAVRALKVGLCLDEQVVGCVPMEEHDVPLDAVVTDSTVFSRGPSVDGAV